MLNVHERMLFPPISTITAFDLEVNRAPPSETPSAPGIPPGSEDKRLPLKTHSVDGKKQAKVLTKVEIQRLKSDVTDAMRGDKEKPKIRGAAARAAAAALLNSLATPAPSSKKPTSAAKAAVKAKAKAKSKARAKAKAAASKKKTKTDKAGLFLVCF